MAGCRGVEVHALWGRAAWVEGSERQRQRASKATHNRLWFVAEVLGGHGRAVLCEGVCMAACTVADACAG